MNSMLLYGLLMLAVGASAVACGLYATLGIHKPTPIHRLYLASVFVLIAWTLGISLSNAAEAETIRLIGLRVASLGWAAIMGLTLHIVMSLTGHDAFLKRYLVRFWIYLPGVVTAVASAIFPIFGLNRELLIRTDHGWMNASAIDGWDMFTYAYTIAYTFATIILLLRCGMNSHQEREHKLVRFTAIIFAVSGFVSVLTDLLPKITSIRILLLAPVLFLPVVFSVGYCVRPQKTLQSPSQDGRILTKTAQAHIYRHFGLSIIFGGIAFSFAGFAFHGTPNALPASLLSVLSILCGAFLLVIDRTNLNEDVEELLVSFDFAFYTPLVILWFSSAGMFVAWAFIFPLMIISLLFNRKIIFITLIASSVMTELYLWAYMPTIDLGISARDYTLRLCIIVVSAFFASYVNRIYTGRLRENVNHTVMQSIASEISKSFVHGSRKDFHDKLYDTLEKCGRFIECDRAYVVLLKKDTNETDYAMEWSMSNASPDGSMENEVLRKNRVQLLKRLRAKGLIIVKNVRFMPPMAAQVRKRFLEHGIRGVVIAAIRSKGEIVGFMGFNANRPMRDWNIVSPAFVQIVAGIVSDAIVKAESEQKLSLMAHHDQLTGLPNRTLLKEQLDRAIDSAKRSKRLIGIAFLDLDSFKAVNDTMGHAQGDRLLKEIARLLVDSVRNRDTVARFGGDEFVLLLDQLNDPKELLRIMDGIMETVRKPVLLQGQEFFVSVSAGVALYPQDGEDADALLKNADNAMYEAKSVGKGKYLLCSQEMKEEFEDTTRLTSLLYHARENSQLLLHYQPQVDLATKSIVGLEALLRWDLPDRGILHPATFLPLAEKTGLIHSIGAWVLEEACAVNMRLQAMGCTQMRIAVNVSVHQLKNPDFVSVVASALKKAGLQPAFLELEITESIANSNAEMMIKALQSLKALGISISIADFGSQYSSLSRLKVLPVDRIKIDVQFVQGIEKNPKDQAITKVIINLAKSLNLKVVAEGVETAPQLQFLSQRQCDEVQGFYFYKPMPEAEVRAILKQQGRANDGVI